MSAQYLKMNMTDFNIHVFVYTTEHVSKDKYIKTYPLSNTHTYMFVSISHRKF